MMDTKRAFEKLDGRKCYHIIRSFKPGEVTPEIALEIAKEFAAEYLPDYEVVIGTHIDKTHNPFSPTVNQVFQHWLGTCI